jgi:hypothetical protein
MNLGDNLLDSGNNIPIHLHKNYYNLIEVQKLMNSQIMIVEEFPPYFFQIFVVHINYLNKNYMDNQND